VGFDRGRTVSSGSNVVASGHLISPEQSRIIAAQNMFIGGQDLTLDNRRFILEGSLTKICRKAPKLKKFFLFDDLLVYGQFISKKKLAKQVILSLSDMAVKGVPDDRGLKFAFQISTPKKTFILAAESSDEKKRWLEALTTQIDLASRDGHPDDKAALWKPDSSVKVCMNCGATRFSAFNRRHHCRGCGKVVCATCSENKIVLQNLSHTKAVRVCISCYGSGIANMKQTATGRLAWLCDSDSDSDIEDLDAIAAPANEEVRFDRFHRSGRVHGI